jgi:hypothetical protein
MKLTRGSSTGQAQPSRYSICVLFDEEIERAGQLAAEFDSKSGELLPSSNPVSHLNSPSITGKPNAQRQLLTALSVFKQKEKFKSKSFVNAAAAATAAANLPATSNLSGPSIQTIQSSSGEEKRSIDTIERQINLNLRQLEMTKLENNNKSASLPPRTPNSNQRLNDLLSINGTAGAAAEASLLSEEVNPSSIYRYRKLKSTVSDNNLMRQAHVDVYSSHQQQQQQLFKNRSSGTKVMCTTLTLNDTVNPQLLNSSGLNTNPGMKDSPVSTPNTYTTRVKSSSMNRTILPLTMQAMKQSQEQGSLSDNNSTFELNMKSLLAASRLTTINSFDPEGDSATQSLANLNEPSLNSSMFGSYLKTVYYKNPSRQPSVNNYNIYSQTQAAAALSNTYMNSNMIPKTNAPKGPSERLKPIQQQQNPTYTDLYVINPNNQNFYLYNNVPSNNTSRSRKITSMGKMQQFAQKTDHRFSHKKFQSSVAGGPGSNFESGSMMMASNSFVADSQQSFGGDSQQNLQQLASAAISAKPLAKYFQSGSGEATTTTSTMAMSKAEAFGLRRNLSLPNTGQAALLNVTSSRQLIAEEGGGGGGVTSWSETLLTTGTTTSGVNTFTSAPNAIKSKSISINGKSYKLPDSLEKSTNSLKLFAGSDLDMSVSCTHFFFVDALRAYYTAKVRFFIQFLTNIGILDQLITSNWKILLFRRKACSARKISIT